MEDMENMKFFEQVMEYRNGLINCGKRVTQENPDRLNNDEMQSLLATIFEKLNELDMSMGHPYYDTGTKQPANIDKIRKDQLFVNFLDWYEIMNLPSNDIYQYVLANYPVNKYPKVLCVGDGENVHLGRKLAKKGYTAVSVDPEARKEFAIKKGSGNKGSLHVVKGKFFKNSIAMLDWADIIIGSKVTEFTEELIALKKPTIFNISGNAEIYRMNFNGRAIKSSHDLEEELKKCKGITIKKGRNFMGKSSNIYIFDEKENEIDR